MSAAEAAAAPRNVHGHMSFGISSTALLVGTTLIGILSVMASMGLPTGLYRAAVVAAHGVPLLMAAWGVYHGVMAFVLARRGIPCHNESEFAAFLGLVIGLATAAMFLWFGLFARGGAGIPSP